MSYSESERKLTNEDFRKIFMTPRHSDRSSSSHQSSEFATPAPPDSSGSSIKKHPVDKEKHEQRKKRKQFYSKIKKEEDEQMLELAKKYRDRAKERREGAPGSVADEPQDDLKIQGAYRAVAPDFRGNEDAAERRRKMIQESKYLGGDMEHTHLVKGLDYALLQKVKSELENEEEGEGEETKEKEVEEEKDEKKSEGVNDIESGCRTKLGRNVYRVVFKTAIPARNELFTPGRMAYVMDLEDEYAEDVPHTLIRSKADVPAAQGQSSLTTNDIVINKLTQILSYLRTGSKSSKKHKKLPKTMPAKVEEDKKQKHQKTGKSDENIYDDVGDYVPSSSKSKSSHSHSHSRHSHSKNKESSSKSYKYFEKSAADEDREVVLEMPKFKHDEMKKVGGEESKKKEEVTFGSIIKKDEKSQSRAQKLLSKMNAEPEGYAECYPGFDEMHDAIDDSDDEYGSADFSKMDPGKKKGTLGRWDFDSVEEYGEYMSNKEALPKAAFQFGVKMNDGRKTRKHGKTEKSEKAQLDKQWQQIQQIMSKRKGEGGGEGEPVPKTPRN